MIDQLIAALNQEVDLSAEEIADTLWLAMHMEKSGVDSTSRKSRKSKPNLETIEDNSNKRSQQDSSNKSETKTPASQSKSLEKQEEENQAGLYNQKPDKSQKSLEIPFKVPDAPSLREQLDLARALRPLMRRISSGSTLVLDEAATSQRIADEGIWLPVLKPTLEPWLDLELVVDEGISMQIWRHTIKELERLLKNYGILRDVRVWGLISKEQNKIQIRKGIGAIAKNQSPRSAAELIDSSGRRLVLVVSDCVSDLWRSGAVNSALKTWANNVPTAIIQMLPKWLWCRTALGRATEVRFQGLTPSVSNRQLITNTVSLWSEIDEATGIKVPVFTLEPERVSNWAQMLVGRGNIKSSGFVFKPEIRNLERDKPSFNFSQSEFTAEQRVQAFRVTASPMARKLAGLLASAPVISLPVVRLIRETMLKDSKQVHVAEVFLGGLLKPLSEIEVDTDPDYVQYGFIDGVRELLVDSVPSSYVLNVVEEVSKFVAKKVGLSLEEFAAVLKNPEQISDSKVVEQVQPFAMVTAQILRRLGEEYAKLVPKIFPSSVSQGNLQSETLRMLNLKIHILTEGDSYNLSQYQPFASTVTNSHPFDEKRHYQTAILLIGGAEDKFHDRTILKNFWSRAGREQSSIAIIPSASREPLRISDRYIQIFEDLGVKEVKVLDVQDRAQGNNSDYLNYVKTCTGIFITGGDQLRLCSLLANTPLIERILERVRNKEITLATTSGGSAAMGQHMISGGSSGESPNRALVDTAMGLGFLPEVLIDQHFFNRNRLARLLSAIAEHPNLLGIGIDEDTCAVFEPEGIIRVIGKGSVTIIDPSNSEFKGFRVIRSSEKSKNYQEDNLKILINEIVPYNQEVFFDVINQNLEGLLLNETVTSYDIPDDNNEATIDWVGSPNDIDIKVEWASIALFSVNFSLTIECGLSYFIFKADYYGIDDERADRISIGENNDHYFSAEETYTLQVEGIIFVDGDSEVLESPLLSHDELLEFLQEADISIDSITNIEVIS
jgi:cyanophycinase